MFFWRKKKEDWVESPVHNNWYSASSYFLSSFALITTVNEDGITSIGPYQLCFPFGVWERQEWIVISRGGSNTSTNLKRRKKCALNFVEYDQGSLKDVIDLGYPEQDPEEKMKGCPLELEATPTMTYREDPERPKVISDAFQVFECELNDDPEKFHYDSAGATEYLLLTINHIHLREYWKKNLDLGGDMKIPKMPISYGFRNAKHFFFAQPKSAFWLPVSTTAVKRLMRPK